VTVTPVDASPPSTTISLTPASPNGTNGWYTSAVAVTVSAGDPDVAETRCALDPVAPPASFDALPAGPCSLSTVSGDGQHVIYAASADTTGNKEVPVSKALKIDGTGPSVVWDAHPASYTLDQLVTIGCSASDAGSDIASHTCGANGLVAVPASTLGVGPHTLSASATDNAGNVGSAQTSFTVIASTSGVCALLRSLVQTPPPSAHGKPKPRPDLDKTVQKACDSLAKAAAAPNAKKKAQEIKSYKAAIDKLVSERALTVTQGTALKALGDAI
jgi:hypothetical protein